MIKSMIEKKKYKIGVIKEIEIKGAINEYSIYY